jgi:hypothetical protein
MPEVSTLFTVFMFKRFPKIVSEQIVIIANVLMTHVILHLINDVFN